MVLQLEAACREGEGAWEDHIQDNHRNPGVVGGREGQLVLALRWSEDEGA